MKEPLASRLLFPWTERRFTYAEYERFLDRLGDREVVPMREFARGVGDLALRHDADSRLDSPLELARLEHARGLRATYFVLHTAPYWREPALLPRLRRFQELGHEVGFHNDLVTLQRLEGVDAADYLRDQLARLRGGGIEIVGAAAHGSPWCHRLGFHNNYVFDGWDEPVPGFPATEVPQKLDPADFGLEYEAYHVPRDAYFSDSTFMDGRRAHPADLRLEPGKRTIVLVHPCHWDSSALAKVARLGRKAARRLRR
ncbi:MAG TPA: hypothetical protein VE596_09525 [Gaiellaceae bacterium]|nr:hypothetical protein [Gaiellaceae bacterium]